MITSELEKSDLKKINIDNLMDGKDSKGANMPPYSNSEYANFKTSINPSNRGFWDLRVTGQYHLGISFSVLKDSVRFWQKYNNEKTRWLDDRFKFFRVEPLGVTKEQLEQIQIDNIPIIREKLIKIINGK